MEAPWGKRPKEAVQGQSPGVRGPVKGIQIAKEPAQPMAGHLSVLHPLVVISHEGKGENRTVKPAKSQKQKQGRECVLKLGHGCFIA
jgi:hypothetical protein